MKKIIFFLFFATLFMACENNEKPKTATETTPTLDMSKRFGVLPEWAKNANIYEVNIRQYSEAGTIAGFQKHLPRLKKMGVDILWLMPIFPVGEKKRKGVMGSAYSVKDYQAVNPDYGTMAEFKSLVKAVHDLDMKIILDWVPNHSSWDNAWITAHPDWYTYDHDTITHPLDPNSGKPTGWTDVADLNYDNQEMRKEMIESLKFWVTEADIDGYRCDVAGFVPHDFWKDAIITLNKEKHVFMLAEWSDMPELFDDGFNMDYSWEFKELIKEVAHGKKTVADIWTFYKKQKEMFSEGDFHMYFITNHDENSWNNYPAVLGDAKKALAVLAFTFDGMPLIYSGQESGLPDTLSFFYKDLIKWEGYQYEKFYTQLLKIKHQNEAIFNGKYGGLMQPIDVGNKNILAFFREKNGNRIEIYINLSKDKQQGKLSKSNRKITETLEEGRNQLKDDSVLELMPWGYSVLVSGN